MLMGANYWEGKQVLCLGAAGFLGSFLVERLLRSGANVSVLDNFSRGKNKFAGAKYTFGDCSREGVCRDALKDQDVVFNLAAEVAGVEFNQSHNAKMFFRNVLCQMMPLRIAAEYQTERFLQVSSICVYSPEHLNPCKEENGFKGMPSAANLGYSMAKRSGELMADWYAREAGLHTVVVRPTNLMGPRDYFDDRAHVIPALMAKAADPKTDEVVANGTGWERREFLYVDDAADGLMAAAEHGRKGEAYNLGTNADTCVSIGDLLEMMLDVMDSDKTFRFERKFDSGDDVRWSDASKANRELGWEHLTWLELGLLKTWEWYRETKTA